VLPWWTPAFKRLEAVVRRMVGQPEYHADHTHSSAAHRSHQAQHALPIKQLMDTSGAVIGACLLMLLACGAGDRRGTGVVVGNVPAKEELLLP
jgi:hypothetical protein